MKYFKYITAVFSIAAFFYSCSNEETNQDSADEATMKYIDPANMDLSVRAQDDFFRYAMVRGWTAMISHLQNLLGEVSISSPKVIGII